MGQTKPPNHSFIFFSECFELIIWLWFFWFSWRYGNSTQKYRVVFQVKILFCRGLRHVWLIFPFLLIQQICSVYFLHEFRKTMINQKLFICSYLLKVFNYPGINAPKLTLVCSNPNFLDSIVLDKNKKLRIHRSTKYWV